MDDRKALAALLATADCFVHPNANEPFGLAPLEAASAGCRVVIPKRAGAAAVLAAAGAVLVADDAPATLAHGIARAMRTARPAKQHRPSVGWPSVFASEWQIYARLLRMTDAGRTVIFSIHDVAPQTLPEVAELRRMIHADAGPVPVSLLVVPRYHGADAWCPGSRRWISDAATRGDEIVLHGFEHWSPDGVDGAEFDRQMTDTAVTCTSRAGATAGCSELGLPAARLHRAGVRPPGRR